MAKESTLKNMVLCLTLVCMVCSALLGVVYGITKEPIEQAALAKANAAVKAVLPEFDNSPIEEQFQIATAESESVAVYPATKGGEAVGWAVASFTDKGFSGHFEVMVGFDADGNIFGTSVLSQSETPGLGAKMTEPAFADQFKGKNPETFKLSVKKDGGDIDAITAATISSRAYADAVQRAYSAFKAIKDNSKQSGNE